jgi:acyl dehydratase
MKFVEFYAGQQITAGPYEIKRDEILTFASAYDPQWFHIDFEAASDGPFKGLIASGWHTCSIAMRLIVESALADSETYASPGLNYVKWPHPVRPDDLLTLLATVIEARRSSSNPQLGILRWRWQLHNQHEVEVLDLEATSFFYLAQEPKS